MIGKRLRKGKPVSIESNWPCLREDLLVSILDRLVILSDYVRFSAVCMPWHAVALEKYHGERRHKLSMHQPPLLFLTRKIRPFKGETTIHMHNINKNKYKTYELESFEIVPSGSQKWCCSSHGWLISVDNNLVITLSHPFCSNLNGGDGIIRLPRVPLVPPTCDYIVKVILSADPIEAPDDYTVMVIYNPFGELVFIRPHDKAWTRIEGILAVVDVIYSKGLFYALDELGSVKTCDINYSDQCRPKWNKVAPNLSNEWMMKYIVESAEGDLLQLLRFRDFSTHDVHDYNKKPITHVVTKWFKVFKLLVENGEPKWVETKNLDDGALFLGDNISTYVSASNFLKCQPNSIYFMDYCQPYTCFAHYDVGIFNLGDGRIQRDCVSDFLSSKKTQKRPPVFSVSPPCWIEPTFKGKKA